jgi:EAL domain-containing protein (putative c-di-GMP-specific phosphodiesterase class I)
LGHLGCGFGLGYFLGRPAPAEEVERLLYQESQPGPRLALVPASRIA